MSGKKEFKTLDEQIEILLKKGLIINNVDKTKDILLRENYFFLNGYRLTFYKSNTNRTFIEGTTFEELYALFCFDRALRNIMFKNILIIENNFKSIVSYQLSKRYGFKEKDYLHSSNFSSDHTKLKQINDILGKMKRQIRANVKQHSATLHYITNYGYIPLWILVKVLSFGIVSELYTILKDEDKLAIANYYNVDISSLETFLVMLSNYRNICAHEDVLYNYKTQRTIPNNRYHRILNVEMIENEYKYGKNDVFSLLLILKQLLTDDEFRLAAYEVGYELEILKAKVKENSYIKIKHTLGFPNNWKDAIYL